MSQLPNQKNVNTLSRRSNRLAAKDQHSVQYLLNPHKSLEKKFNAAERNLVLDIRRTKGGVRILAQAGMYEIMKASIFELCARANNYSAQQRNTTDEAGMCVYHTLRISDTDKYLQWNLAFGAPQ